MGVNLTVYAKSLPVSPISMKPTGFPVPGLAAANAEDNVLIGLANYLKKKTEEKGLSNRGGDRGS